MRRKMRAGGRTLTEDGTTLAAEHARALLARFGLSRPVAVRADHPALAWRRAGLMAITGRPDGPALVAPVALTAAADGALAALRTLAPGAALPETGAALLGERARLLGLQRRGRISSNGGCRLIDAADATIALNLPREDDWELIPAWLGVPVQGWDDLAGIVASAEAETLVARARLLGLAAAVSRPADPDAMPFTIRRLGSPKPALGRPLVVDLSALWAGPLAGALLQAAGARVVKVESSRRPDGARGGNATMFDLLNGGKESVVLDFTILEDVRRLRSLVARADIVIESARPRALAALGIIAAVEAARGATWVSITAYGRDGEAAGWIGYGDDAVAAGGLVEAMRAAWGEPLFAGDALADPLTGLHAAFAALASHREGGGRLISLALADVVAYACALHRTDDPERWQRLAEADFAPTYAARWPVAPARPMGADTAAVLVDRPG